MDFGLLLLRLLLGVLLFGHSTQKLLGWFGGAGRAGTAVVFEQWGFKPGVRQVVLAGVMELIGAVSIALGLLTPGGCAVVVGTMTVAAVASAVNGFWAQKGGCEVPFCYGALAAILALTGPGRWSLDAALEPAAPSGYAWGAGAVVVGLLAASVPLTARARVLRARRTTTR
jgi:putative oxidoreductase